MKRNMWPRQLPAIASCAVLVGLGLAAASLQPASRRAEGTGSVRIDRGHDHDEAIGAFEFHVSKAGSKVEGELQFAAEDHGARGASYPHIVVRVESIDEVSFRHRRAIFSGDGWMQGETVRVTVEARDGATEDDFDTFTITCSDENGVLYEATGRVFNGSIQLDPG